MITPNTPLATNDELEAILGKEDWLYTDKPARIGALIAKRERAAQTSLLKRVDAEIGNIPDDIHNFNGELRGKWQERKRSKFIVSEAIAAIEQEEE